MTAGITMQALLGRSAGGVGPSRVFTAGPASMASLSTFNFGTLSLGTVATGRKIVVGVTGETTGTNFAISSFTVGGVGATSIVDRPHTDTLQKCRAALYRIADDTNASANVTVTFAGSMTRCQVGVWALYDLVNAAPSFTAQDSDSDGNASNIAIDIPATGILLTLALMFGGTATQTLSGAGTTDRTDGAGVTGARQWASYQAVGAEIGRAVSFSGAGAADSARALVAASWA